MFYWLERRKIKGHTASSALHVSLFLTKVYFFLNEKIEFPLYDKF